MQKHNNKVPNYKFQKETKSRVSNNFDQQYLYSLNLALCRNFEKVIEYLGHSMSSFKNYYASRCPIHDGDNETALTIYTENEPYGWWLCNTRACHKHFPRNLIGFIWAYLSAKNGWTDSNGNKFRFDKCLEICQGLVGHIDLKSINFKHKMIAEANSIKDSIKVGIGRDSIRRNLIIPADFFINRGFKAETLDFFDIGLPKKTVEMSNRVIAPIYNENFIYIGCQGRSLDDSWPKWKNSKHLEVDTILYNYHNAKPFVKPNKTIILVEGPADVWRLWEAGIKNCVATLGNFKTQQQILLETSGAINVVCMFDNDEAGAKDYDAVKSKCSRLFNINKVEYGKDGQDPADLTTQEIREVFKC